MKKSFFLFVFISFWINSAIAETQYKCEILTNGRINSEAHLLVKKIDFNLAIDTNSETASINGKMVARNGSDRYDNESMSLFSYFNGEKDFNYNGQELLLESYDTSVVCGEATAPCRIWEKLKFNQKTLMGSYEKSYSYSRFFGETINYISIGFQCKK